MWFLYIIIPKYVYDRNKLSYHIVLPVIGFEPITSGEFVIRIRIPVLYPVELDGHKT